jgi:hypothetical protein
MLRSTHRPSPRRVAAVALTVLAGWVGAGAAAQDAPAASLSVRHCVGGEPMQINLRGDAVLLDDADRRGVAAALGQRFAVLGPAFDPVAIVLWRRPEYGWVYVALETPQRPPPAWCFSATFAAPVFDFTPALQRKYFAASTLRS